MRLGLRMAALTALTAGILAAWGSAPAHAQIYDRGDGQHYTGHYPNGSHYTGHYWTGNHYTGHYPNGSHYTGHYYPQPQVYYPQQPVYQQPQVYYPQQPVYQQQPQVYYTGGYYYPQH